MKKNIYYSEVVVRKNLAKSKVVHLFYMLSSLFRIPVEAFLRKNFGERYFSSLLVTLFTIAFIIIPYLLSQRYGRTNWSFLFEHFTTWYLYTIAFIYFSYRRYRETKRNPSVFDFKKFSQYEGDIKDIFLSKKGPDGRADMRAIEIFYEPGAVLLAGLLLVLLQQPLGLLIVICAVMYSLSYRIAYLIGDHFIMDQIDMMIMNEEMEEVFVNDKDADDARGVRFSMKKPGDITYRKTLMDNIITDENEDPDDEDDSFAVVS